MPYRVTSTGPHRLVSHLCPTPQAALAKALALICADADDVCIVVDGRSYSAEEFEELPVD